MKTHQSKIEKLIAELCPNGVEFKELGQVATLRRGRVMSNSYHCLLKTETKMTDYKTIAETKSNMHTIATCC